MAYCTVFPMPFIPFWKILSHHMGPTTRWTAAFELSRTENSCGSLGCKFWPWRHRPLLNLLSCCCMCRVSQPTSSAFVGRYSVASIIGSISDSIVRTQVTEDPSRLLYAVMDRKGISYSSGPMPL